MGLSENSSFCCSPAVTWHLDSFPRLPPLQAMCHTTAGDVVFNRTAQYFPTHCLSWVPRGVQAESKHLGVLAFPHVGPRVPPFLSLISALINLSSLPEHAIPFETGLPSDTFTPLNSHYHSSSVLGGQVQASPAPEPLGSWHICALEPMALGSKPSMPSPFPALPLGCLGQGLSLCHFLNLNMNLLCSALRVLGVFNS